MDHETIDGMKVTVDGLDSFVMPKMAPCARCGKSHENLPFKRLLVATETRWPISHFSVCPETLQPVLLAIGVEPAKLKPRSIVERMKRAILRTKGA